MIIGYHKKLILILSDDNAASCGFLLLLIGLSPEAFNRGHGFIGNCNDGGHHPIHHLGHIRHHHAGGSLSHRSIAVRICILRIGTSIRALTFRNRRSCCRSDTILISSKRCDGEKAHSRNYTKACSAQNHGKRLLPERVHRLPRFLFLMLFLFLFLTGSGSVIAVSIPVLIISLIGLICVLTAVGVPAAVSALTALGPRALRRILSGISILPAAGILRAAALLRTAALPACILAGGPTLPAAALLAVIVPAASLPGGSILPGGTGLPGSPALLRGTSLPGSPGLLRGTSLPGSPGLPGRFLFPESVGLLPNAFLRGAALLFHAALSICCALLRMRCTILCL